MDNTNPFAVKFLRHRWWLSYAAFLRCEMVCKKNKNTTKTTWQTHKALIDLTNEANGTMSGWTRGWWVCHGMSCIVCDPLMFLALCTNHAGGVIFPQFRPHWRWGRHQSNSEGPNLNGFEKPSNQMANCPGIKLIKSLPWCVLMPSKHKTHQNISNPKSCRVLPSPASWSWGFALATKSTNLEQYSET